MWNRKKWRAVSRLLEIPDEAALGSLRLTILENREILIENHQGIVACTETVVKIKIASGWLFIAGERLHLQDLQSDQILLSGAVREIRYED